MMRFDQRCKTDREVAAKRATRLGREHGSDGLGVAFHLGARAHHRAAQELRIRQHEDMPGSGVHEEGFGQLGGAWFRRKDLTRSRKISEVRCLLSASTV